jgi:hypothetical protein
MPIAPTFSSIIWQLERQEFSMAVTLKSLGLENAPLEVRLQLMEELWESIAQEPEPSR